MIYNAIYEVESLRGQVISVAGHETSDQWLVWFRTQLVYV